MKWIKLLLGNMLVFLAFFAILEMATRIIAPAYKNAYFTKDVTWGQQIYRNKTWGHRVGLDQVDEKLKRESPVQRRILFVGDSVTFGYGIRYEDTYHRVANRLMQQSGCNTFVHGAGMLNSDLNRQINDFRDFIMNGFGADLVIYQFNPNDVPIGKAPKHAEEGHLTLRQKIEEFRISYVNRSAFFKAIQSVGMRHHQRGQPADLRDDIKFDPRSNPDLFDRSWQAFEKDVTTAQRLFNNNGIDFWIVLVPEAFEISSSLLDNEFQIDTSGIREWPADRVKMIAARHKIPVLDTTGALKVYRKANANVRLYFPNDSSHPTATGHEVVGEELARVLRSSPRTCVGDQAAGQEPQVSASHRSQRPDL